MAAASARAFPADTESERRVWAVHLITPNWLGKKMAFSKASTYGVLRMGLPLDFRICLMFPKSIKIMNNTKSISGVSINVNSFPRG